VRPENSWVRYETAAYLCGKGIVWGVEDELYNPAARADGRYAVVVNSKPHPWTNVVSKGCGDLKQGVWDFVVLGPEGRWDDGMKLLRPGGHLVWWNTVPAPKNRLFHKGTTVREGQMVSVFKKATPPANRPSTKPRACVARYGALGDYIIITPVLKALHEEGYDITFNGTPYAMELAWGNPYITNTISQEREIIPNVELGPYWDYWKGKYDRYINLSESLEGSLLKVEGRRDFFTTNELRHRICNKNYYDHTLALAGFPNRTGQRGELFILRDEERKALDVLGEYEGKFTIVWSLNGSSQHKIYPMVEPVLVEFLDNHPDVRVIFVGDNRAKELQFEHPQVLGLCGETSLHMSLGLIKNCNLVVSPESFVANAAGCWDVSKIILFSHSSPENLTKYWSNCTNLIPDTMISPCYGKSGCHQLHYSLESCPLLELYDANEEDKSLARVPACTVAISPARLYTALRDSYSNRVTGVV